jgi:hypothetical protein
MILISERNESMRQTERERERERDSTLIPGFCVHMYTRAPLLTRSKTFSHQQTRRRMCVSDYYCLKGEQPPRAPVYGRGSLPDSRVRITQTYKASRCAMLWAHQRPPDPPRPPACTRPPPPKSVLVDFRNACAENSPGRAPKNM